jgi:hypothetical protein
MYCFFQSFDDPYSRGDPRDPRLLMRSGPGPGPPGFGGSYDGALAGVGRSDPRYGNEFGVHGNRTAGYGPDPQLEDQRRYYSSDSVPMHSESYHHMQQQQQRPPVPPPRGATIADPYYGGGGGGRSGGRHRDPHEFAESDMESVVSVTSAFSSHSAPHARQRRMQQQQQQQPGAQQG